MERPYPAWRKALVSAFILFHVGCLVVWVLPNPSAIKTYLLSRTLPLPSGEREPGTGTLLCRLKWREIVPTYLYNTAQWQDWAMFAPNPLQVNRYVSATLTLRDGPVREVVFPRLSQMNFLEAWIEKRWRKYQHRLVEENNRMWLEDLARFLARRVNDSAEPPVRVAIYENESPIPRHDRYELRGPGAPAWVDYPRLLRAEATYSRRLLLDYAVRPEDLR